jgi:myo-inositol-hexaphosphate 3-phosphohydrolase
VATCAAISLASLIAPSMAAPAAEAPIPVQAVAETTPVSAGDAADDPAIWVNQADRSASLIVGNDKKGALETYDLTGARVQRITTATAFWGNVDVRANTVASFNGGGVRVFTVANRQLTQTGFIPTSGEGLCLYQAPTALYVFTVKRTGQVREYNVDTGAKVRDFQVGSEAEGCVADDAAGALYVSEEDQALWRYGADPAAGTTRIAVDTLVASGGHLVADIEGVTIGGDYLIASAQNVAQGWASYFVMYDRTTNRYVKSFRVVDGVGADDCDRTDGVAAYAGDLGPAYPSGLFVCQDSSNVNPAANQDFKLVPWKGLLS